MWKHYNPVAHLHSTLKGNFPTVHFWQKVHVCNTVSKKPLSLHWVRQRKLSGVHNVHSPVQESIHKTLLSSWPSGEVRPLDSNTVWTPVSGPISDPANGPRKSKVFDFVGPNNRHIGGSSTDIGSNCIQSRGPSATILPCKRHIKTMKIKHASQ